MYRDFSDRSLNELLGLVAEVENSKLSNFTDWVGDRWYDFESWIGKLSIRNYLNNVNAYHKKVIDKNNATRSSIKTIFSNVKAVDNSYKNTLSGTKSQLQQWQRYIGEMSQIIAPQNGKFNASYISKSLNKIITEDRDDVSDKSKSGLLALWKNGNGAGAFINLITGKAPQAAGIITGYILKLFLKLMSNNKSDDTLSSDEFKTGIKTGFDTISSINKIIGKLGKKDGVTLSSSVLSYLGTLCGLSDLKDKSGLDTTSEMLSLYKSSVGVETGIFDFYEKYLHPYEAAKLDARFGKTMTGLKITSDVAGIADSVVDTYKVYVDPESTAYDKAAETIEAGNSVIKLGGDVYVAAKTGTKTLQIINSAGSSKAVNQILSTEQKLQYTTTKTAAKTVKNVGAGVTIATSVISGIASATKQYGEVTADGNFNMGDAGSVALNFGLSGLDSMASSLTFGLVDIDSESFADELETDAESFVQGDSWAANYIKDQDNCVVARFGVSVGVGVYLLGDNIVEGVADTAKAVGSWISSGWNTVTNLF